VIAYADTGLICSLYAPDAHSSQAAERMFRIEHALPWTWLHQVEFRNAMRLRVFRAEISVEQREASFAAWRTDLTAGVWIRRDPSLESLLTEAEALSDQFVEEVGARSLDVLHVAAARILGCRELWTFDRRQRALAVAAGFTLL
jgi:predicted nucleic acid-binding protein